MEEEEEEEEDLSAPGLSLFSKCFVLKLQMLLAF